MPTVKRIKCGSGNCYIVKEGDSSILIDTATSKFRDMVLDICKEENVKLIILTHAHIDHCQNAQFLSQELNIPIAMSKDDEELILKNENKLLSVRTILGRVVLLLSSKSFKSEEIPTFKVATYLSQGDSLHKYGIGATIISLPGHTNGSIGLDIEKDGIIVGDALMHIGYPTISLLYRDYNRMIESAKKISEYGERIIYFGHGKPVLNRKWVK